MKKKKFCFISLGNLYLCPYISKYTSQLNGEYDVIYWNRHEIKEDIGAIQHYSFDYKMPENTKKINKLKGYIKFKTFTEKVLKDNKYDGVILLQTSVGILLQNFLRKRYKKKYILDIRDYTLENNKIFFLLEKNLIKNSAFTVISSEGYVNFLPEYQYVLTHNDISLSKHTIMQFQEKKKVDTKITISYIGLIRFHTQNKKVIMKFKNDNRFILKFIGKDANALAEFCDKNDVKNVELVDRFPPEKTLDYYYDTDIVYNLYGNDSPLLNYALSNKLYYAAQLGLPILVSPNTYMEKISASYGFGFAFDINDRNACDKLFNFYMSFKKNELLEKTKEFLEKVNKDNKKFNEKLNHFIR